MKRGSTKRARAFIARIAKLNNTTPDVVRRYLRDLSGRGVSRHLDLGV